MTRARDTADLLVTAPDSQALEPKTTLPLIINGSMQVSERLNGSQTAISASGLSPVQRYKMDLLGNGTYTITQDTDVPSGYGFKKSVKIDCTTADAADPMGANDRFSFRQIIEDQNCLITKKGHSDAEKLTVAFWVKTNKTGNYVCELYDLQNSRHVGQVFTVSSSNTWEKKVLAFPADTTGKFAGDNGQGLMVNIWLGAGSNYSGGGSLQTSWGADSTNQRAVGINVNIADHTDNYINFTGWQLEVGEYTSTTLPVFKHIPFELDLLRCQRYFLAVADGADQQYALVGLGSAASGDTLDVFIHAPTELRTTPSLESNSAANYYQVRDQDGSSNFSGFTGIHSNCTNRKLAIYVSYPGGITQGVGAVAATNNTSAYVYLSAEL